jgi:hypothetical protein
MEPTEPPKLNKKKPSGRVAGFDPILKLEQRAGVLFGARNVRLLNA